MKNNIEAFKQDEESSLHNIDYKLTYYKQWIQTYITRNYGGKWNELRIKTIPDKDNEKNDVFETLHIHGNSGEFPRYYSSKLVPGLILANGNTGFHLSNDSSDVNTYISRDAGLTWNEVNMHNKYYNATVHDNILNII